MLSVHAAIDGKASMKAACEVALCPARAGRGAGCEGTYDDATWGCGRRTAHAADTALLGEGGEGGLGEAHSC